jgi:exonuclease SbcC
MRLRSISARNFRLFQDVRIELQSGVTGIVGANGTGKSTILEMVAYALYGSEATRGTMAGLRWKGAVGRQIAEVTLVFEVGGLEYVIDRDEREATLAHQPPGEGPSVLVARGTSAVNAAVPTLLGMSYSEFSATYLAEQKQLARLAAMKPTERQTFMREVMGIGRIDEALARCRTRKNELCREVAGVREGLGERAPLEREQLDARNALAAAEWKHETASLDAAERTATVASLEERLRESTEQQRRHTELRYRLDEAVRTREYARQEMERLAAEIDTAHASLARLREAEPVLGRLPALRLEREEMRVAAAQAEERTEALARLLAIADQLAGYERELQETDAGAAGYVDGTVEQLVAEYRAAERALQALRTERVGRIRELQTRAAAARDEMDRLRDRYERLSTLGAAGHCPTCSQVLGVQFETVLRSVEDEALATKRRETELRAEADAAGVVPDEEMDLETGLEDLRARGEQARAAQQAAAVARAGADQLRARIRETVEERDRLQARASMLRVAAPDPGARTRVEAEIAEIELLDSRLGRHREQAGGLRSLQDHHERLAERVDQAGTHAAELRTELERLAWDPDAHAVLEADTDRVRREREQAIAARAAARASAAAATATLERATRALTEYDTRAARFEALLEDLRIHERAADRLDAFRVLTAGELRPELEELASGFVSLLTDGRHEAVVLGEDFSVTLHEAGVPLEIVSGGTEDVTAIALRLAVSQMIAERAGHPLTLLILDEPFGSLDPVRRSNVLDLIRRLNGVFSQVVLISHVDETREAVDHVIEVEYDEARGVSRVRQSAGADESPAPAPAAAEAA